MSLKLKAGTLRRASGKNIINTSTHRQFDLLDRPTQDQVRLRTMLLSLQDLDLTTEMRENRD
jgi:hypothetical protein